VDLLGTADQFSGLGLAEFLVGADLFDGFDSLCLQKLGGSRAGSSAVAVIVPVDALGHSGTPWAWEGVGEDFSNILAELRGEG
jgi:hypothetical protein